MKRRTFLLGSLLLPSVVTESLSGQITVPSRSPDLTGSKLQSSSVTLKPIVQSRSSALEVGLLLRAIAEVETGNNDSLVGKHGERSRYQIRQDVWQQHMAFSHAKYCHGGNAELCAHLHLRWLDSSLVGTSPMLEKEMRPYCLAWCWHGGLSSWLNKTRSIKLSNYATRVQNLYDSPDFHRKVTIENG